MPFITGEIDHARAVGQTYLLPKGERRGKPIFLLQVHPDCWDWDPRRGDWLPNASKLAIIPGCGGTKEGPKGSSDDSSILEMGRSKLGWKVIPNGDHRLAQVLPGGEYRAKFAAERGPAYGFVWEGYEVVRGKPVWGEDFDLRVRVLREIVRVGILPELSEAIVRDEIQIQKATVLRLAEKVARAPTFPILASQLREAEAKLKAMYAAAERRGVHVSGGYDHVGEAGSEGEHGSVRGTPAPVGSKDEPGEGPKDRARSAAPQRGSRSSGRGSPQAEEVDERDALDF